MLNISSLHKMVGREPSPAPPPAALGTKVSGGGPAAPPVPGAAADPSAALARGRWRISLTAPSKK